MLYLGSCRISYVYISVACCRRSFSHHPPPFHYPLSPYTPPQSFSLLPVKVPVPKKVVIKRQNYEYLDTLLPCTRQGDSQLAIIQESTPTLASKVEEVMRTLNGRKVTCTELKIQGSFCQPEYAKPSERIARHNSLKSDLNQILLEHSSPLPPALQPHRVFYFCANNMDASKVYFSSPKSNHGGPSQEKLEYIAGILEDQLPKFFDTTKPQSFDMYRKHMTCILNFVSSDRLKFIRGKEQYSQLLGALKIWFIFGTYCPSLELLNVNTIMENGTVRVRWRIVYRKYWQVLLAMKREHWLDFFSVFHVDSEGYIVKHVVDKVMPDDGPVVNEKSPFEKILRKAAPKPATSTV